MKGYRLTFYKDRNKQHRWRLRSRNGKIVANAGEGYRRAIDCRRIALTLFPWAAV